MKKHLLFILSISVIFIGSCKKSEPDQSDLLYGKWYFVKWESYPKLPNGDIHPDKDPDITEYENKEYFIQLNSDGTSATNYASSTYDIDGEKVRLNLSQNDEWWIYSINGTTLTLNRKEDQGEYYDDTTIYLER